MLNQAGATGHAPLGQNKPGDKLRRFGLKDCGRSVKPQADDMENIRKSQATQWHKGNPSGISETINRKREQTTLSV